MAGFENDVLVAKNMNFDETASKPHLGIINAAGKLPIGTGNSFPTPEILGGSLTSPGGTLTIGYSSPNITIDVAGGGSTLQTLSDDVGTVVTPLANNIQLVGHVNNALGKFSTVKAGSHLLNINPMSTARWIVDPLGFNGTHTTIASAISSASSGETIYLMPGTYTENFTLPAGIDLVAYVADSQTPNVIINGTVTMTAAGTSSISGVQLKTNSAAIISMTGSNASTLNIYNCNLNLTNTTGISTSNSSAKLNIYNSTGNLGTTGIAYFSNSGSTLLFENCNMTNSGASTTASTSSSGSVTIAYCNFINAVTTSNTSSLACNYSSFRLGGTNTTALTIGGSGTNQIRYSVLESGSASALSIGAAGTNLVEYCSIDSTNTNAITGAGSITYAGLVFTSTSSKVNTTTQVPLNFGPTNINNQQPAFQLSLGATRSNVTGDGTTYVVVYDTTTFDQVSNTSSGTTFTAPYAGLYFFIMNINISGLTAAMTVANARILKNAGGVSVINVGNIGAMRDANNTYNVQVHAFVQLAAGDAITTNVQVSNGTKVASVGGGATFNFFAGWLVC